MYQRHRRCKGCINDSGDATGVSTMQEGATGVSTVQEGATEHENGVEECVDQLNKLLGDIFVVVEIYLSL